MKEVYAFETRPQQSKRRLRGTKDDAICVSLNNNPEMSQWIIDKARSCNISRAEVVRQCIEFIMHSGKPH